MTNLAILLAVAAVSLAPAVSFAAPAADPAAPPTTAVLVHGAWADGSSYDKVIAALQAKGLKVIAVQNPLSSFADDVAAAKRAIDQAPGKVVLVGHSYGGVVITEAGNSDKVVALVYLAAFAPDANESVNDMGKGQPPPEWAPTLKADSAGYLWMPAETVAKDFVQDQPPAEQKVIAAKQGPTNASLFDAKVAAPAWKTKPSWYVVASDDKMIDPKAEAMMARRAGATTTTVKSGHVVMLSHAKAVVDVILAAAAGKPSATK